MLESHPVTTILPVVDPARARRYYQDVLGLEYLGVSGDGKELFRLGADGTLALLEKPPGAAAEHTALSFEPESVADRGCGGRKRRVRRDSGPHRKGDPSGCPESRIT